MTTDEAHPSAFHMDPKLLFQLSEVIFEGSLSRAALSLHVTQPTLTRNMKAIEEAVGAPVLRRSRHGVTPTTLGERLAQQGRDIARAMAVADDTVKHWRTGLVGEVRLGVGAMLSASQLPGFFAANPLHDTKFSVHVYIAEPADLVQKLRSRELDVAIVPSCVHSVAEKMAMETLFSDQICVMAGSRSPLVELNGKVQRELLATQSWISVSNMSRIRLATNQAEILLGINEVVPKFKFDGDITAFMAVLRDSVMLALAPRRFAKKYVAQGGIKIIETDVELPKREFVLMVADQSQQDSSVTTLVKKLKDYFQDSTRSTEPETISTEPDTQVKKTVNMMDLL